MSRCVIIICIWPHRLWLRCALLLVGSRRNPRSLPSTLSWVGLRAVFTTAEPNLHYRNRRRPPRSTPMMARSTTGTMSVARSRAGDELRFGRLAVPRHSFGLCPLLLQSHGAQDRRRKPDDHSFRADTVMAGPRLCTAPACDRRATVMLCPRYRFRTESRRT